MDEVRAAYQPMPHQGRRPYGCLWYDWAGVRVNDWAEFGGERLRLSVSWWGGRHRMTASHADSQDRQRQIARFALDRPDAAELILFIAGLGD